MKKRLLTALAFTTLLSACAADKPTPPKMIAETDLATHNWVLTKVDSSPVTMPEPFSAPTLQFDQDMAANGHSGCNRYFGQAELKAGKLRIEKMGMTMMACPAPAMEMEQLMSSTLMDWSQVSVVGNELVLSNPEHTLVFKRQAEH
ncbi:META domain-containing protein [Photobacterium atrarenae]|uniref:META domain-containing protein n=1 Tax=Photobacterium atrarenae TaxID=865757 RepID=A0ABY5GBW8_9GAMM|nr:META domain-containing protein [Photobacterium atrarenae]UTV26657.1 META domain-containing protein [Photobacterium atrarenae]